MKKFILFHITLCFYSLTTYSQVISSNMTYFVINQYVSKKFDTTIAQNVYIKVKTDEKLNNYTLGNTKIIFFNSTKEDRFYRKLNKSNGLYHSLKISYLNSDTIDFDFSECHVTKINGHYCIEVGCGGDMGYIPFARIIYSKDEKKWRLIHYDELKKNAILELPNAFEVQSCANKKNYNTPQKLNNHIE